MDEIFSTSHLIMDLKEKLDVNPEKLSEVDNRKFCIAKCLVHKPEAILLDDPFAGLEDPKLSEIAELVDDLRRKYSIVIASREKCDALPTDVYHYLHMN